jgi:hypothetical protein
MSMAAGWPSDVLGSVSEVGPDDARVSAIARAIRAEFAEETDAGFPGLSRIPSTRVTRFLDHFATLAPPDRAALLDALAHIGALHFFPAPLISKAHEQLRTTDPVLVRFHNAMGARPFSYGLRYVDLRMARAMLRDAESRAMMAQTRAALDFEPRDDLPKALVGLMPLLDIQTIRAPELRKLLNAMLAKRLGAKPQKRLGGELVYEGSIGDIPLRVSIIFSNLYAQMSHGVGWAVRERGLLVQRLTYEIFWGAAGGWDYLTAENAARSIELLGEILLRLARLFERVLALPELA